MQYEINFYSLLAQIMITREKQHSTDIAFIAITVTELTILCLYIDIFLQKCVRQIHSANVIEYVHKRFCLALTKHFSLQKLSHY